MTSQIRHRYISLQIDRRILCDRTTTYDVIIFKFHMTRAIALPLSALPADAPVCNSNTYWVRCQPLPKAKRWPNRKQNSTSYECIDQTQRRKKRKQENPRKLRPRRAQQHQRILVYCRDQDDLETKVANKLLLVKTPFQAASDAANNDCGRVRLTSRKA